MDLASLRRQLEIYWVDLDPARGAETRKKRPCLVLQADDVNRQSRTLIVAPLLPDHRDWPFVVNLHPSRTNGLDHARHVNLKQMRAVDVTRISNRQGRLEPKYRPQIEAGIRLVFGLG